jgi:predicted DNA-binding transcriptional regulator YafY
MALLFVLQRRRSATAAELAAELEVSERTIYRDVASLTEVGVPLWTEPGPGGGIRLVDGWRTRLDGLTGDEAAAMFAMGAPQLLAELGMGTALAGAQAKILATLPEGLREHARVVAERVHLDAPAWFHEPAEVEHLGTLAQALWEQRRVSLVYRKPRVVDPLGLVLKAGVWYLVARVGPDTRTYRAARITEATLLDERFERPDFDLPAWWAESAAEFAATMLRETVRIRLSERGLRALKRVTDVEAAADAVARAGEPDAEGRRELTLAVESLEVAASQLVSLGGEVEALDPGLRERLASHGKALWERNTGPQ